MESCPRELPKCIYRPLAKPRNIRLMTLFPGRKDEQLRCHLSELCLDEERHLYETLSYAWCSTTKPHTLVCDDHALPITNSLFGALRRLRRRKMRSLLWVDAVCINQQDTDEKNHQVPLMRDIYAYSLRTVIWLGENEASRHYWLTNSWGRKLTFYLALKDYEAEALTRRYGFRFKSGYFQRRRLESWNYLFSQPWFLRVWILQEVTLSSNEPIAYFGSQKLKWRNIQMIAGIVSAHAGETPPHSWSTLLTVTSVAFNIHMWLMSRLTTNFPVIGTRQMEFVEALYAARFSSCTNPRDRIYGLLGLLPSGSNFHPDLSIIPDYNLPRQSVYTQAATYIIMTSGSLDLLRYVEHVEHPATLCQPSWVPDWNFGKNDNKLWRETGLSGAVSHERDRYTQCSVLNVASFVDGGKVLVARGIRLASIQLVGQLCQGDNTTHNASAGVGASIARPGDQDNPKANCIQEWFELWLGNMQPATKTQKLRQSWLFGGAVLQTHLAPLDRPKKGTPPRRPSTNPLLHPLSLSRTQEAPRSIFYNTSLMNGEGESHTDEFLINALHPRKRGNKGQWTRMTPSTIAHEHEDSELTLADLGFFESGGYLPVIDICHGKRFCITIDGTMALCPSTTEAGDEVFLLRGVRMPIVLRPKGDKYLTIGPCYVHRNIYKPEHWEKLESRQDLETIEVE